MNLRLGQRLRAARQAKGLSLAEAAEGTRIKSQVLEDLENEDFSRMPAVVYAKGFLKIYAEFLGLEPGPLIEEYLASQVRAREARLVQAAAEPLDVPADRRVSLSGVGGRLTWRRFAHDLKVLLWQPAEWIGATLERITAPRWPRRARPSVPLNRAVPGVPVWQLLTIGVAVLLVLVLAISAVNRYLRSARRAREYPTAGANRTLRLAEEPPPPYLPSAKP